MTTAQRSFALLLLILAAAAAPRLDAQLRVTGGVKGWAPTWNLTYDLAEGVTQSDYSAAIVLGPYLSIRYKNVSVTGYYTASLRHFEATAENPGRSSFGFNGNRAVSRQDINLLLNYHITSEFALFGTVKLLRYETNDALSYINGMFVRMHQTFASTGFGGGVHIGMPFSGNSPFYSFLSAGVLANNLKPEDVQWKYTYGALQWQESTDGGGTVSELVYFLDAGLGYRVPATDLGFSAGLRVENGRSTKTILGPTASVFYSL